EYTVNCAKNTQVITVVCAMKAVKAGRMLYVRDEGGREDVLMCARRRRQGRSCVNRCATKEAGVGAMKAGKVVVLMVCAMKAGQVCVNVI
ncbi:hypothetical protein L9F63_024124, partial [Diploptera punctata]